jgi:hypothetical protein
MTTSPPNIIEHQKQRGQPQNSIKSFDTGTQIGFKYMDLRQRRKAIEEEPEKRGINQVLGFGNHQ